MINKKLRKKDDDKKQEEERKDISGVGQVIGKGTNLQI